ncbi:hypothetical protein [Ammoniphilus sp. 3BR4]|uniref:hypothetical protein n=1 Tax=Ammoniphilus sp. 3BR4 TaxID=3158265 RepID=UPI0034667EDA
MSNETILILAFVLAWVSVCFLKKQVVKRYMPVALFAAMLVTIVFEVAYTYQWWKINTVILNWDRITNVWFVFGPFLIGTIWIFYFTFKRFWLFMLTNVTIEGLHMVLIDPWVQSRGIYELITISRLQVFLLMVSIAFVIYLYQLWQEELLKKPINEGDEKKFNITLPILKRKQKVE